MSHHPEPAWIIRNLTCSNCGRRTKVRMEGYWLQYEWTCGCGSKNLFKREITPLFDKNRHFDCRK